MNKRFFVFCGLLLMGGCISANAQHVLILQEMVDVQIYGEGEEDRLGRSVEDLGDVNHDGAEDLITVIRGREDPPEVSYLVFGGTNIPGLVDLASSTADRFSRIPTADRVGSVGDFNGDGWNDFAAADLSVSIGELYAVGETTIFYGTSAIPFSIDFPNPQIPYTKIRGHRYFEIVGNHIRKAGDFNGDGLDDVMIAGRRVHGSNITEVIILFGGRNLPQELSTENLGEHGVILTSAFSLDKLGESFAPVGDVNGDGLDDVLIAANAGRPENYAYLVYGATDFPSLMSVADLGDRGLTIFGGEFINFAPDVSGAGDINGDGYNDLLFGNPGRSFDGLSIAGEVYILFGSPKLLAYLDLSAGDMGQRGVVIQGGTDNLKLGQHVLGGLNLNGDQYPDLVIVPGILELIDDIYVIPGGPEFSRPGTYRLNSLHPIILRSLSGGINYPNVIRSGDINGDGYDDILIGDEFGDLPLPGGGKRDACGAVYVVFGGPERFPSMAQRCDLNGDGEVDLKDLFLFGKQWQADKSTKKEERRAK